MSYRNARRPRPPNPRTPHPQPRRSPRNAPGSFVERKRSCGRPNCHCADGKNLHSQFQISVVVVAAPRPRSRWACASRKTAKPKCLMPWPCCKIWLSGWGAASWTF
ncbi:MAG: DUF6788 family protein [Bryobacteraceae bacterium]